MTTFVYLSRKTELLSHPDAEGNGIWLKAYRTADEDSVVEPVVGGVDVAFEFWGCHEVGIIRRKPVDSFIAYMDGHRVSGHYGIDGLKLGAMLNWIYQLIVGTSRDDFSIDFARDFPSGNGYSHSHSMWIFTSIDCLSDFCANVKDMREGGSLGDRIRGCHR